jgi:hypothetical protein
MDDRELEGRLRMHLHRRFDAAQTPPGLADAVRQGFATSPRPLGLRDLRVRAPRLGWSIIVVPLVIAILAIAQLRFGVLDGIGGPRATATPAPTPLVVVDRRFLVLPPTAALPTKPETSLATEVLMDRLSTLDFQVITGGAGYAIQFMLPPGGPDDDRIRAVLSANGEVEFVPLPAATYGDSDGKLVPRVGEPLPTDEPALFGWEGIESVAIGEDQQSRQVLDIVLKPAAAEAFGDYTTEHRGEYFAMVLDGRVAFVPIINEPITGGEVQLSGGELTDGWADTMAILVGGPLPDAWRDPVVPELLSAEEAITAARDATAGGADATLVSAELDVTQAEDGWEPHWVVQLSTATGEMQVVLDARRGR